MGGTIISYLETPTCHWLKNVVASCSEVIKVRSPNETWSALLLEDCHVMFWADGARKHDGKNDLSVKGASYEARIVAKEKRTKMPSSIVINVCLTNWLDAVRDASKISWKYLQQVTSQGDITMNSRVDLSNEGVSRGVLVGLFGPVGVKNGQWVSCRIETKKEKKKIIQHLQHVCWWVNTTRHVKLLNAISTLADQYVGRRATSIWHCYNDLRLVQANGVVLWYWLWLILMGNITNKGINFSNMKDAEYSFGIGTTCLSADAVVV